MRVDKNLEKDTKRTSEKGNLITEEKKCSLGDLIYIQKEVGRKRDVDVGSGTRPVLCKKIIIIKNISLLTVFCRGSDQPVSIRYPEVGVLVRKLNQLTPLS